MLVLLSFHFCQTVVDLCKSVFKILAQLIISIYCW